MKCKNIAFRRYFNESLQFFRGLGNCCDQKLFGMDKNSQNPLFNTILPFFFGEGRKNIFPGCTFETLQYCQTRLSNLIQN